MFGISYLWHGVFLNDLSRLSYSLNVYFIFAPIAYIAISLIVVAVHRLDLMNVISKNVLVQGFLSGVLCGFFIYVITVVVGISFAKNLTLANIVVDSLWQMLEQGIGGIVVSLVYVFTLDSSLE